MLRIIILAVLLACLIGCRGTAQFCVRHNVPGGPSVDASYVIAH